MSPGKIPFLRFTLPLCAGVIAAEYLPHIAVVAVATGAVALALMAVRLAHSGHLSDILFGAALILFMTSSGYMLRYAERRRTVPLTDERQTVNVRLSGYPEKGNRGYSFRAKIIAVTGSDTLSRSRGTLLLWFMTDTLPSGWKPGDFLQIEIRPQLIRNNGNPCEFNYQRWMEGQGIIQMAFFRVSDIRGYSPGTRLSVRERSMTAARKMTDAFRNAGLKGEELGLVMALTIGDKELLGRERLTSFSRSGAMHIMAVSGLHVGMISMALSWILFFLRGKLKRIKPFVTLPALWGFAFITGLSPSVLRATIMFSFLQAGTLLNRPAAGMNSLLASAFILTAAHPGVIFEAGFQLSYLAVGFILIFYTPIYRLVRIKSRILDYIWQTVAVSLTAQAGTLALSVRLFNIFPLLFLLTNIVVIPVSFLVMVLAMLLLVTTPLPALSSVFALLLDHLAAFTLGFTGMISSMNHGVVTGIGMSVTETVLLTVSMALLMTSLLRTAKISLRPFLVTASLLLVCNTVKTVQESRRDTVITYNIRGDRLTVRQHGRILLVPLPDGAVPAEIQRHAFTRGLKIKPIGSG